MDSPFGKKLFRLFLLFALIPASILALTGYFLSSESRFTFNRGKTAQVSEVAAYYNVFLYDKIRSQLEQERFRADEEAVWLDFVVSYKDQDYTIVLPCPELSDSLTERLVSASLDDVQGVILQGRIYFQFYRVDAADGSHLVGGVVHGPEYYDLLREVQAERSSVAVQRDLATNYILFAAILLVVVGVVTGGAAYYFSSRMARNLASPLAELSDASKKIAGGDFDQTVRAGGIGEIATLVENFNSMARQLKMATARLAQSERVAAWRNIARRFAHELKNPLQPIMVSLYRIEKNLEGSEQYEALREPLQAASEELKHLTQLADRFSQLAKLPPPVKELTSLNEFLRSAAALYEEALSAYDFKLELPSEEVMVNLDPTYFREVIHNLLQNAVDATPAKGVVILRLFVTGNNAVIEVRDCGRGMSQEVISSARMPYFTTKAKGSGLGLAVVEKIVEELAGSLAIESVEGAGTTVSVSIPLRRNDGQ